MTVLRKDPLLVGSLRYNRLTEKIDVTKVLWWNKEPCVLTNKGRKALRYFFEKYYGLFNESVMDDALDLEAYSKEYHPIAYGGQAYSANRSAENAGLFHKRDCPACAFNDGCYLCTVRPSQKKVAEDFIGI